MRECWSCRYCPGGGGGGGADMHGVDGPGTAVAQWSELAIPSLCHLHTVKKKHSCK